MNKDIEQRALVPFTVPQRNLKTKVHVTLNSHQMFPFHTTPEELKRNNHVLDLWLRRTLGTHVIMECFEGCSDRKQIAFLNGIRGTPLKMNIHNPPPHSPIHAWQDVSPLGSKNLKMFLGKGRKKTKLGDAWKLYNEIVSEKQRLFNSISPNRVILDVH